MAFFEALILALIALIITPVQFFYFDVTPKILILLGGAAILLILASRRKDLPRAPRLFTTLLLLNAASLAVSTAFSSNRGLSLFGSTWRYFGAAIQCAAMLFAWLIARHCAGRPDRARIVLRGLALTGILAALYGIAQYSGFDPLLPQSAYRIGEGFWSIVRPPGTFGYASYFATWLLGTVFLSLALSQMEKQPLWRWLAYTAAALSLIAMVLTGTRAAVLGLAAGALVWFWWRGFRLPRRAVLESEPRPSGSGWLKSEPRPSGSGWRILRDNVRSARRTILAAVLLLLASAAFYFSPLGHQMRSRSRWFVEDPWGGARPLLWRDSLLMSLQRPLAGFGPEVFLAQFPLYESKALAEAYPDFIHESPHNIFLDAFVAQGLPGLAALLGLCAAGFLAARRLKRAQPALGAILAAALAATLTSQQFTSFTMPTAVLFLVAVALTAALAADPDPPRPSSLLSALAPIVAVALLFLTVRIAMADRSLAETKRLFTAGDLPAAADAYDKYQFWRLPGSSADLWYARQWMEFARRTNDLSTLERSLGNASAAALAATDNAEEPCAAWYTLAEVSALREDYRTTETSLFRAVQAHPNWFKPHWMLAQEQRLTANFEEAEKQASLAAELDAGHHPEVAQTLRDIRARNTPLHP